MKTVAVTGELSSMKIDTLKKRMLTAYEQSDWMQLADLDKECLSLIKSLVKQDSGAMFETLNDLLSFYKKLITKCQVSRDDFADQATNLRQAKKRELAYLNQAY